QNHITGPSPLRAHAGRAQRWPRCHDELVRRDPRSRSSQTRTIFAVRYAAIMPGLFDHVLFVVLAAIGPLWAASFGYRRLARATPDALPRMRRTTYRATIALQLGLASAVVALWAATGR